jgi:hypothetical protein
MSTVYLVMTVLVSLMAAFSGLGELRRDPRQVRVSFGAGYQAVFLSAAALAAVSAIASWLTVRSSDTAPGPSDVSSTSSMACAPQSLTFSTFKE